MRCNLYGLTDGEQKRCILDQDHTISCQFETKEILTKTLYCEDCKMYTLTPHLVTFKCHNIMGHTWKEYSSNNELVFKSGASSSACASFRLIPFVSIKRLADRCQLGLDKKGDAAWNAVNPKADEMLDDTQWVINRYEHAIKHAYLAIGKLSGIIPDDGDDDAAAVMWAGMLGIAADERRRSKK